MASTRSPDLEPRARAVDHPADDLVQREAEGERIAVLGFAEVWDVRAAQARGFGRDDHFAIGERALAAGVHQLDSAERSNLTGFHRPA